MRHWLAMLLLGTLACTLTGCEQQTKAEASPAAVATASAAPAGRGPNDRFYAVQAKLDQGGSFYLYSDLRGVIREFMDQVKPMLNDRGMPPQALQVYAVADQVLTRLGLYGIHDLGLSVAPDGDLNRTKVYISAPEGRQQGILAILGGEPHALKVLDRAPSSTLVLATGDFDSVAAWTLVRQIAKDVGGAAGEARVDQGLAQLKAASGLDLEALNATLAGEFSLLIDQDPTMKLVLPVGPQPLMIQAPRLVAMIRVKDASLYEGLKTLLTQRAKAQPEVTDGKLKLVAVPAPPNPVWPLFPALATDGEYVYLSTHQALIKEVASPTGPLLRDSAEFKALTQGLPTTVNGLSFVSPRLGKTVVEVLKSLEAAQTRGSQMPANPVTGRIKAQFDKNFAGAASVRINEPDGVMCLSRSKSGAAQFVAAMMVAPVGVMAAIAVPNFLEAQSRSKVARVRGDMRTMTIALETYYLDQNAYPAWTGEPQRKIYGNSAPADQPGFTIKRDASDPLMTLTTPVAYLTSYFKDPFATGKQATFSYWSPPQAKTPGYIIWSPGPDGQYSLNLANIAQVYDPTAAVPSPSLVDLTYDPSNGTTSGGDVWRVKQ